MGTAIGIIVGLAGVFVGVITYLQTRDDRHLDFEVLIYTKLLHADAATLEGHLRLFYGSEEIEDPYLTAIRLVNTGNRPIKPEDQLEPIHIDFGDSVRLLYAETVEGGRVKTDIYLEDHYVKVPPVLFNQGDWIAIKLLTDRPGRPSISGRIVGVRDFRPYHAVRQTRFERWFPSVLLVAAMVLFLTFLRSIIGVTLPFVLRLVIPLGFVLLFTGAILLGESVVERRVEKRRKEFYVTI